MTPMPRVSFVIPCHNHGLYLDEAVDSVFAQTIQDFDIVIVNDGSTNADTNRLLASYTRPRTRVVRTEHRGLSAARNTGIAATTAPFLCMLDADDRLEPHYLERSLAAFDEDPDLAFVSHWLRTFGDENWEWTPTDCSVPALLAANTVNGAALVRRPVVEAAGGFDESMRDGCEDWDFWISVLERGYRGRILHEFLFWYRRRADSMSRVMFAGTGLALLYGRLVEKHPEAFRRHLPDLLSGQERDLHRLSRDLDDINVDLYEWTTPERDRLRDDVDAMDRRSKSASRQQQPGLDEELDRVRAALEIATTEALTLHAESHRTQEMLDLMRASASWRVTAPLRWFWRVATQATAGRRR
jgi:glycosyltransferase involved in cell wall biosynthesis